jgi:hypothetical protein
VWSDLNALWNDSVWSKVIASTIIGIIGAGWAAIRYKWWERFSELWAIELTMTNHSVSAQPGAGYPLKYFIEMRNDSSKCIAVRVLSYSPKTITVKSFPPEVMQVRFYAKWFPTDQSAETVAVLPGQLCRAWIGIDEGKFNEAQVKAAAGSIGTLVVSAHKKHFSFQL